MKAKFYLILTGLLTAACITSYGQEIVSSFEHPIDQVFSYNDLQICSDGSVLSGIYCYSPTNGQCTGIHVCKVSSEGQLIDSVTFPPAWELLGIPGMPDVFLLPDYRIDNESGDLSIEMTFIDADLNIIDHITTLLANASELGAFMKDIMLVSPNGDLIVTYWTEDVFHIARIGLDGTVKAATETTQILPQNPTGQHLADSALFYTKMGVFSELPESFYKLGGYVPENDNDAWPLIAYIFDENLILTDTIVYSYLNENSSCELAGYMDHMTPVAKCTPKETYLLAAQIRNSDDTYSTSLIRYDKNHNPMAAVNLVSPSNSLKAGTPICTEIIDENTIYHTYNIYPYNYFSPVVCLARLDKDLNVVWNINLPLVPNAMSYGTTLKVLANGNIAVSVVSGTSFSTLYIYIIHDDDPTDMHEMTYKDCPFTLYPNPVKDQLTLRFDDGTEPESVEIFDLQGRLFGTKANGMESIDMGAMPAGVFMLRVTMKDGTTYHEKILKE